ncbi:hypothetical protein M427DRAFT_320513 [Gonapodya prolifera JEL478]|uniref:Uncharacterized protein n=1 Tax=Gonapodya prolifera (strain JEL478) TaxID=1344416 RepID=A0A139AGX3_GONPJ|nr:hypothetical protein M427DRAFT_320513 [Gonapodya prolifera JEL478]|eukprot:KXS15695.1 hypothetical protein M427DRAFT_320513 [Gonapodya prolifera JEL478]
MPLFSFALDETRVGYTGYGDNGPISRPSTPSLGTLLAVVRSATSRLKALSFEYRHLNSREAEFEGGRSFDGLEIKEIANEITDIGRINLDPTSSMQSRQTVAFSGLKSMISLRVRWLNESLYTLEQALYLVLRHLVYYFEEYKPSFDGELSSSLANTLLWPPQPTSLLYNSGGHATNPTKSDLERVVGESVRPTAYAQSSLTMVLEELSVEETLSHVSDLRFKQSLVGNNTLAIEAVVSRAAKRYLSNVHY